MGPVDSYDRVTAWHVRLAKGAGMHDTKGWLSLTDESIRFVDASEIDELEIPFGRVRKVRRVVGSPIIIVLHEEDGRPIETAFYFVQPPPLNPPATGSLARGMLGSSPKRKNRRRGAAYLGQANQHHRDEVKEWHRRIREAVAGRGDRAS
jgi:hypothetical protein